MLWQSLLLERFSWRWSMPRTRFPTERTLLQKKCSSHLLGIDLARDLSGDTIRQLIRGRHNSAIRGHDRLWI
jgi:hypothetical protein